MKKLKPTTLSCRIFDHDWHFTVEDRDVVWRCARGCGEGGRRTYGSVEEARRHCRVFNRPNRAPARVAALFGGTLLRRRDEEGRS